MDIELYIDGQLVDLNDNTNILFNYKTKDLTNPTIIKNSFTKTIELPGTDNNNNVFGHIWDVQRVQGIENFNPSKRVEFKLFKNGELVETGYCKLDSIRRDKGNSYSITCYGRLGDFYFNLMYSGNGEKRTLADMDYGYDLGFTINRTTVNDAWNSLFTKANNKYQKINFAPCYNGLSSLIDNDKVIVNTNNYTGHLRYYNESIWEETTGFPSIKGEYKLYNGYGLAELPAEMTEWETRDLRSYLQRPVISMKAIVEACCNPDNNGGYTVDLDSDFFTDTNPYYSQAWVTLPMLDNLEKDTNQTSGSWNVTVGTVSVNTTGNAVFPLNTTDLRSNATYSLDLELRTSVRPINQTNPYITGDTGNALYTSTYIKTYSGAFNEYGGYAVQMVGLDSGGNEVCGSQVYWLTTPMNDDGTGYLQFSEVTQGFNPSSFQFGSPVLNKGYFVKNGNDFVWSNIISLKMKSLTNLAAIRVKVIAGGKRTINSAYPNALYNSKSLTNNWQMGTFVSTPSDIRLNNPFVSEGNGSALYSNSIITQHDLLSTEYSPADYLISYAKLFNLYFEKDAFEKKIYIKTQRNYYDGERMNIEDIIDRSKTININPLSFSTKWYEMQYKEGDDSSTLEDYKNKFGTSYGIQKINTGYEFDAQTNNLLKDNLFKNAVQVQEISNYYSIRQSDYDNECPTFLYNNVTWKLINNDFDTEDITIAGPSRPIEGYFNRQSSTNLKYDAFPKVQFHNENDPVNGENVLLFYNGVQNITSTSVYQPYYYLTDDLEEMLVLNGDKPCWIYTQGTTNINGDTIAIQLTRLPQFSRYTTVENLNSIYYTWDFGRPQQIYVNNVAFSNAETTIYERYWSKYLQDLYDIDTRVVEAYVKFDDAVVEDYLKRYYWWDNSYWVINEIIDYNPVAPESTKVKFIKVNDLDAYTEYNPAEMPQGIIKLTLDKYYIGAEGGIINGYVYVDDGGPWYFDGQSEGITTSVTGGTGSTYFTITVAPNTNEGSKKHFLVAFAEYGDMVEFTQLGTASAFNVAPAQLILTATTGVIQIINPENNPWNIVSYPDWIGLSVTSGNSEATITVTVTDGNTSISRTGNIVVYNSTTMQNYICTVGQYSDAGVTGNTQSFNVTELGNYVNANVPVTGGTIQYLVKSVGAWSCYTSAYYCNPIEYTGTGNTETGEIINVAWESSDRIYTRDGTLTFNNEVLGNVVEAKKTQNSLTTLNLDFGISGGSKTLYTTVATTVNTCPNWVTINKLSNGIDIIVSNNPGNTRQGTIIIGRANDNNLTIYVNQEGSGSSSGRITISPSAQTAENTTSSVTFTYTYMGTVSDFGVASNVDWAVPSFGSGNRINVRLEENRTLYDRTATITVTGLTGDEVVTSSATLTQYGSDINVPDVLYFDYTVNNERTLTIRASGNYEITIDDE